MATEAAYVDLTEGSAPATPGTGIVRVYAKTDGSAYQKDDAGTETGLAGGGGGGLATDALADAAGDTFVASGNNAIARLPIGASDGMSYRRVGGAVAWQGVVGAKAYHNTTQVAGGTDVALLMNSEEFDTSGFHDTGSNTSRMTVPSGLDGTYIITFGSYANGASSLYLLLNGTTQLHGARTPATGGAAYLGGFSTIQQLAAADYVEIIGAENRTYSDASDLRAMTTLAVVRLF